jgi:dihydrofolate reductase
MAKLTITTFVSLDGVMQAPGGPEEDRDGGFASGGWVVPHFDEGTGAFVQEIYGRVTAFLLGRRTYEIFASHWPHHDDPNDPVANNLNHRPKYVATRTLDALSWQHSTIVRDVVRDVTALKQSLDGELQVHGSGDLAQTLIAANLIDTFYVMIFPVVTGPGKRLFGGGTVPSELKLVQSSTTTNGIVRCTYERVGALRTGSYGLET